MLPSHYQLGKNTTSTAIISALKSIFSQHGIPETLMSDNGPQYTAREFQEFSSNYHFHHITCSPYYPQSNGLAERGVRAMKQLLSKTPDIHMALLIYRSTLLPWCGLSPAELLMGRQLRNNIPITQESLVPEWKYLSF